MTVSISLDNGVTFPHKKTLWGPGGYVDVGMVTDSLIGVLSCMRMTAVPWRFRRSISARSYLNTFFFVKQMNLKKLSIIDERIMYL